MVFSISVSSCLKSAMISLVGGYSTGLYSVFLYLSRGRNRFRQFLLSGQKRFFGSFSIPFCFAVTESSDNIGDIVFGNG